MIKMFFLRGSSTQALFEKIRWYGLEKSMKCPGCNADALYKYGKTVDGKQKYQCILCGRQFIMESPRKNIKNRPTCPKCGEKMHLYMKINHLLRFRCASYPVCKTYLKIKSEE